MPPKDMPLYEGTKRLYAKPMTRGEYNTYRGWLMPTDEDPAEDGYLVEYTDGGKPNDERHDGYISWSPKDVFENTYYRTDFAGHLNNQVIGSDTNWQYSQLRVNALNYASQMQGITTIAEYLAAADQVAKWLLTPPPETAEA